MLQNFSETASTLFMDEIGPLEHFDSIVCKALQFMVSDIGCIIFDNMLFITTKLPYLVH